MQTVKININTDPQTKQEAEQLFAELGLNMTSAINMFLKRAVRVRGIPFEVTTNIPNAETQAAIKEADEIAADPAGHPAYSDIDSLRKALGV